MEERHNLKKKLWNTRKNPKQTLKEKKTRKELKTVCV
jgi:hypothetical protein